VFKQSRSVDRDQTETREAYKLFRDLLENQPSGAFADSAQKYMKAAADKLAEKEYNSARFYQKVKEREAAVVCYKSFVNDFPGSAYAPQARLNMAQALIELGRKAEAREVLDVLLAQEQKGEISARARTLLAQCKE
jgi:outer membrane protein assembly factor BamD